MNPERRLPLLTIPGALHFVGIREIPVPIDDVEIAAIQAVVRSGLFAEPWPFPKVGQRVRLEEGPLASLEGILVETSKGRGVVVSVTLLGRSVAVAVESHWIKPLDGDGRLYANSVASPEHDHNSAVVQVPELYRSVGPRQPIETTHRLESERVKPC